MNIRKSVRFVTRMPESVPISARIVRVYVQLPAETEPLRCLQQRKPHNRSALIVSLFIREVSQDKHGAGSNINSDICMALPLRHRGDGLRCCRQRGGSAYPGQCAGMSLFSSFTIYITSETDEQALKLGSQKEM